MTTEAAKLRKRFRARLLIATVAACGAAVLTAILMPREVERAPEPVSDGVAPVSESDTTVAAAGEANGAAEVSAEATEERADGVLSVPQIVKQYDEDKDGKLQRAEAPLLVKPFFARMDINADGGIDQDEAAEMERRRRVRDAGGEPVPQ